MDQEVCKTTAGLEGKLAELTYSSTAEFCEEMKAKRVQLQKRGAEVDALAMNVSNDVEELPSVKTLRELTKDATQRIVAWGVHNLAGRQLITDLRVAARSDA